MGARIGVIGAGQVGAAATEQNQLPTGLHMGLGARTVSIGRNAA